MPLKLGISKKSDKTVDSHKESHLEIDVKYESPEVPNGEPKGESDSLSSVAPQGVTKDQKILHK